MNNLIEISFDIKYKIYKLNINNVETIIQFKNNFIYPISQSIRSSSRFNSQDKIISYDLGIIFLINNITIIPKNNDMININFVIKLENHKPILTLEDIEEIIYCVMPFTYDFDGKIIFSKDSKFKTLNYTFEALTVPFNIIYNIT